MKVKLTNNIFYKKEILSLYKISNKSFIGDFKSSFKGTGLDFYQNRIFTQNDSIRQINWNLFAKFRNLYVKEYVEDRNRFNVVAVDISSSMFNKFHIKSKIELALETALTLLYSSLKINDNTCFILFDNKIRYFYPFNRKFEYFFKIINSLKSLNIELNPSENISEFVENLFNILKKRSQIFLISDFAFEIDHKILEYLLQKHSLCSICIEDEEEIKLSENLKFFSASENPDIYEQIPYHQLILDAKRQMKKVNADIIIIKSSDEPILKLKQFLENKITMYF